MKNLAIVLCLSLMLLVSISGGASAQILNLFQWGVADGGNDHWYGVMSGNVLNWWDATSVAYSEMVGANHGYLATSTSLAENDFIFSTVLSGIHSPEFFQEFWLGGYALEENAWMWYTGEEWDYTNWGPNEPNFEKDGNVSIRGEFAPHSPPSSWNNIDLNEGQYYSFWSVVEWGGYNPDPVPGPPGDPDPPPPIPEPATIFLLGSGLLGLVGFRKKLKR